MCCFLQRVQYPQSCHDRAVVVQNHKENKMSATREKAKVEPKGPGDVCMEDEITKEMETPRLFLPPWDLQPGRVPYGLCRAAPASVFSSHCTAGGREHIVVGWEWDVQPHDLRSLRGSRYQ